MTTKLAMQWKEYGEVTEHRPASLRLVGDWSLVIAVSPVMTPADPDWKSKVGSLEWQCSAESFNKNVGWVVKEWHWSVVRNGQVLFIGNETTRETAQHQAIAAIPPRYAKRHEYQ